MAITNRIRPAEAPDKFDYLKQSYRDIRITIDKPGDRPLSKRIKRAGVVIDIKSMAMLIAHLLNKPVVSHMPIDRPRNLPLLKKYRVHNLKKYFIFGYGDESFLVEHVYENGKYIDVF